MQLSLTHNKKKKGIELLFSEELPKELAIFLREIGFKESFSNATMWYADKHPAYETYATSLKEVFAKGEDWKHIIMQPSFAPSLENIDNNKFSVVAIYYRGEKKAESQDYVLFDSYKKVSTEIATRFAIETYGEDFKHLEVFPRNYKVKARSLFKEQKIISSVTSLEESKATIELPTKEEVSSSSEAEVEIPSEITETTNLRETLSEVIGELLTLEETLEGEAETILSTTVFDLEETAEQQNDSLFKNQLTQSIQNFKDWVDDLDASSRLIAIASMSKLTQLLDGTSIPKAKTKAVLGWIRTDNHLVQNLLVPRGAGVPFEDGNLKIGDQAFLEMRYPHLYKINDDNLKEVSSVTMFQLSQMSHPKDYGIDVNRSSVLQEWERRGAEAFEELGFPTDLYYPYVNIHVGYKSVSPLGAEIKASEDRQHWWTVAEHTRPIADPAKGIAIIDELLMKLVEKRLEVINPKTGKPKTNKESKDAYHDIEWEIDRLEKSKQVILDYIKKEEIPEAPEKEPKSKKKKSKQQKDYIDRVVATMHTAFAQSERLSKKKIEALKEQTGAPSLGALWEAVELSWLLWYKMIYNEPIAFKDRLRKMELFWNKIQPTYAYSDSSKELYKQYSTPCPIGAIIAEYTGMKQAEFIFEPSAGNGLLVIGANPRRTHVNEIDNSRKRSLKYQGFGRITAENAAEPFPEMMHKVHDVVVTNPPFAKWEALKFDKERIAQKYFHKHRGIANHIRLEHLMAGLALYTMKDDGKAAIIIMGHVYFGEDGLFAKYRPFFNWLYRHYRVDDIINMNSYKLYNKQGAVAKTMLILIGGRKAEPTGVAPKQEEAPHIDKIIETFSDLWEEVKQHIKPSIDTIIHQLKITRTQ